MFEHKVEVNGSMLKGTIVKSTDYEFKCEDIKFVEFASELRGLAIELNQVAAELDKLNGKSTLTR